MDNNQSNFNQNENYNDLVSVNNTESFIHTQPEQKGVGYAVISMVLGIASVLMSCCGIGVSVVSLGLLSLPLNLILLYISFRGVLLGIISVYQKSQRKGMAIAGIILSGIVYFPVYTSCIVGLLSLPLIILLQLVLGTSSGFSDFLSGFSNFSSFY